MEWRLESLGEVAISWRYFDLYVMEVVNLRAPFFSLNNSFLNEPSINQIDHSSDLFAQVTAQSRYFLFFTMKWHWLVNSESASPAWHATPYMYNRYSYSHRTTTNGGDVGLCHGPDFKQFASEAYQQTRPCGKSTNK